LDDMQPFNIHSSSSSNPKNKKSPLPTLPEMGFIKTFLFSETSIHPPIVG